MSTHPLVCAQGNLGWCRQGLGEAAGRLRGYALHPIIIGCVLVKNGESRIFGSLLCYFLSLLAQSHMISLPQTCSRLFTRLSPHRKYQQ